MEFFFEEHLRLDWGLGNPNKTAALIACLLVLPHLLRHWLSGKWKWVLFSLVFLALGICLIHTYSRGGLVAAGAGQLAYWCGRTRGRFQLPGKADILCGLILITILTGYASLPRINATARYTLGVLPSSEPDRSITNRLRIWKDAPRMMVDAPRGWGLGESGQAWTQWYQPLSTRYQYRTLVNSHLSWLVELGWAWRFLYLFAWAAVFTLCFVGRLDPLRDRRYAGISLGIWTAFAVAACFSSVAEAWLLWVLPIVALVWMLPRFFNSKPGRLSLALPLAIGLIGIIALVLTGIITRGTTSIARSGKATIIGPQPPEFFLYDPDPLVVGRHYGHLIRKYPETGWMISDELPDKRAGVSIKHLVLSGKRMELPEPFDFPGNITCLNPLKRLKETSGQENTKTLIVGSLRRDSIARFYRSFSQRDDFDWEVEFIPGKKVYLGDWIKLILPQNQKPIK